MRSLINAKDLNWLQGLVEKLSGPHMFNAPAVVVASIVVTLARVTAFSETLISALGYVIAALIVSQLLAAIFLVSVRKVLSKISQPQTRADLVIATSLFSNVIWAVAMDLILARWQVAQIEYTQWQILSGLIFSSITIIGFSLAAGLIYENIELEQSVNEKVKTLQSSKVKLIQSIKESRIFLFRELALEVQATQESLESLEQSISLNENEVAELTNTLAQVVVASRNIVKNYPLSSQLLQPSPQIVYNLRYVITSGVQRNRLLPIALGGVSVFGVSGWFKYSLESAQVFVRIAILCALGYIIFWAYEKLLMPGFIRLAPWGRVLIFEIFVFLYLWGWIATIGFVAGDRMFGYGLALASAPIPFLLLNVAAFGNGLIISSQKYRVVLTDLAKSLTQELEKLVIIHDRESHALKYLFSGDLAYSPTTASVMMRDAAMAKDRTEYLEIIKNVTNVWKLTLSQLESANHRPRMQHS